MDNPIVVRGARVHNLKNVSVTLPRNKLIVFTGLSGSGKSSLAFDTIFAEGQRRFIESLSAYARQFLDKMDKPDVDSIEGLSPAISIDQKSASHNPRSTVGTTTEIYDYLRLLFATIGHPYCYKCERPIEKLSPQEITTLLMGWPKGASVLLLSPQIKDKKGEYKSLIEKFQKEGFSRVRIDGEIRRLSEEIHLEKTKKHTMDLVVDRLSLLPENQMRLFDSIETCLRHGKGVVRVYHIDTNEETMFSEKLSCPACNISIEEISPRLFSFNSPIGACSDCNGLGDKMEFDPDLVIEFPKNPLRSCTGKTIHLDGTYYGLALEKIGQSYGFSLKTRFCDLNETQRHVVLYGKTEENSSSDMGEWEGIIPSVRRRYVETHSEGLRFYLRNYMRAKPCKTCGGSRLKTEALFIKIGEKNISDLTKMSLGDLYEFITTLRLSKKESDISFQVLKEIKERLSFLLKVGVEYLNLGRKSSTLSGGEFQRIRLATQIGTGLTGVLYVLDEPSIGLHQRDNLRLIETLLRLRDLGNTVIVVEHDEELIRHADHIVDIGPGAGKDGGNILFSGSLNALLTHTESITARYLNHTQKIPVPAQRRPFSFRHSLTLSGAKENNLKNITVSFPLGKLVCVTGVSGSGKSTLINDVLEKILHQHIYNSRERPGRYEAIKGIEHIDKVIAIDQSPIGRTPRSNPATYTGVFTPIRDIFTQTREAKIRGYKAGRFSFNVKGGRCEACEGDGVVQIEMHFLSDVYVTCEVCKGKRFNEQTLEVLFKGYSISDVLNLTVDDALPVFENIPAIAHKLRTLKEVGLGYVHIGQNATTLSGGEAQRIKLAKELSRRSTGKTLYLLDEPTTGLHFQDIQHLLEVLNQLVNQGNTVIVIEHNLDVIKTADYIIDLGPEGGDNGGEVIASGTPEEIAKEPRSYTGQFLRKLIQSSVTLS